MERCYNPSILALHHFQKPAIAVVEDVDVPNAVGAYWGEVNTTVHKALGLDGALTNGLELLADEKDPQMRQRCFELLEQSARTSAAKLKYFRLAYGAGGGFGEQVSVEEPKAVIETLAGCVLPSELS